MRLFLTLKELTFITCALALTLGVSQSATAQQKSVAAGTQAAAKPETAAQKKAREQREQREAQIAEQIAKREAQIAEQIAKRDAKIMEKLGPKIQAENARYIASIKDPQAKKLFLNRGKEILGEPKTGKGIAKPLEQVDVGEYFTFAWRPYMWQHGEAPPIGSEWKIKAATGKTLSGGSLLTSRDADAMKKLYDEAEIILEPKEWLKKGNAAPYLFGSHGGPISFPDPRRIAYDLVTEANKTPFGGAVSPDHYAGLGKNPLTSDGPAAITAQNDKEIVRFAMGKIQGEPNSLEMLYEWKAWPIIGVEGEGEKPYPGTKPLAPGSQPDQEKKSDSEAGQKKGS